MTKKLLKAASLSLLFLFFVTFKVPAQSIVTGGIAGVVTDATGAVISGAQLTLKNSATGDQQTVSSSAGGDYVFALLKPGQYALSVTKEGFKTATRNVSVLLGTTVSVNIPLEVGSTATTVEVSGEQAGLQTENANISTNFETKQIQEIPNPGGDVTYVAQTAPGVTMSNAAGGGYGNFSTFGLPGTSNLFTMNGDDYNDPYLNLNNSGASNLLLGQTEIAEATVTQNGYSVQYGRQSGAQVNYVTKGGTNDFHADLLFNFNNHLMNANDFFANSTGTARPYAVSRQWGADIGGPVIKNKLFF